MPIDKARIMVSILLPVALEFRQKLASDPESWNSYEIEQIRLRCGPDHAGMPLDNIRRQLCNLRKRGLLGRINHRIHGKTKTIGPPEEYLEYLQSDHWLQFRESVKQWWDYRCALCDSEDRLDVHHRTYERIGHENLNDCVCLCRRCHEMADRARQREKTNIKTESLFISR